jgi:hypothetical protein
MNIPSPLTVHFPLIAFLFFLISVLLPVQYTHAAFQLNEDTVFCSYFMISGDKPSEQDVEELCYADGRPSYTAFKPYEMFSKKSLRLEKNRIENRINSISEDPTLIWNVKLDATEVASIDRFLSADVINNNMPKPTPFINARLTFNGANYIKKVVKAALGGSPSKIYEKGVQILVSLRPVQSKFEYEKRIIVEQEVILPIRYVIFQPIKVQILDGNTLNN